MNSLLLSRHWQVMLMSLVVLFAVLTRYGGPLNPAPNVNQVSIPQAVALIEQGALVIDVRQSPTNHLPGAMLIPLEALAAHRSTLEAFSHVVNLEPGFEGWRAAGLLVVAG